MSISIRMYETGPPEVMKAEDVQVEKPETGEIHIRHTAIGLNFIDVYYRKGLYPLEEFPVTIGMEGAGVVESVGGGISNVNIGDRVAYPMSLGAYSEERIISANQVIKIPPSIDDSTAAAIMLKGLTAHYLLRRTYQVKPGDNILVYAAAGGVGLILCQWAKHLGAKVIACVGSPEKAELAMSNGCEHTILYRDENIPKKVDEFTGGDGVDVVYDSVGPATLEGSLDSLKPFGLLVSYGNSSGPIVNFNPAILSTKGSLYLTRPSLATHVAQREMFEEGTKELFDVINNGYVNIKIGQTYLLKEITRAHHDLETRNTIGSTVLLPNG